MATPSITINLPAQGNVNQAIPLSFALGGVSYAWNFGDGTTSNEINPTKVWANAGVYTVTLQVTGGGVSLTASGVITILGTPKPLSISLPSNMTGTVGQPVQFTPTVTGGVAPLTFSWAFGDGQTGTQQNPSHVYATAGNYGVGLAAKDANGISANASTSVIVTSPPVPTNIFPNLLNPPPLPFSGAVVNVATEQQLQAAVTNLKSGQTIVIAKGTYNLTAGLYIGLNSQVTNVGIRGSTNNPDDVKLLGKGMDNGAIAMGISVWNAQNVVIANLSIGNVWYDCIELKGDNGANAITIYNCHLFDSGEQIIKGQPKTSGGGVSNSSLKYCRIGYTTNPSKVDHGGGTGYTNGLDIHGGSNWIVSNNVFENFHTPDGSGALWAPAVLFWNHSANNVVDGNTFINCDRAIAFGLNELSSGFDCQGGAIKNNFITMSPGLYSASRKAGSDGVIIVWDSPNTVVAHNTILTNGNTNYSIQLRFKETKGVSVVNNLTDVPINTTRDGATGTETGNYSGAATNMFINYLIGDLHLVKQSLLQVPRLASVTTDYDGQVRNNPTDAGADQFSGSIPPPLPIKDQTIAVSTPIGPMAVGDERTLSATASSGLIVAYAIDPATTPLTATLVGVSLTATSSGSIIINYDQPGNISFNPAPQVKQTIQVGSSPPPPPPAKGLLHKSNLTLMGAFRAPDSDGYTATGSAGYGLALAADGKSLFIVGGTGGIGQISIPTPGMGDVASLPRATAISPVSLVIPGLPSNPLSGSAVLIGGLLVHGGKLVGTAYLYYDASGSGSVSHFTVDLATNKIGGLYKVGTQQAGYVAGYMCDVPAEWLQKIGAPCLTGQSDIAIISRTSNGPAAFGFDPATLGSSTAPVINLVAYPQESPLGPYSTSQGGGPANPIQNAVTQIAGMVFPTGTSSLLHFGNTGAGYVGYGIPSDWGDAMHGGKGPHALNGEYIWQVWAYDANDLLAVKSGAKQPWQIVPYDTWNFTLPWVGKAVSGAAYDPATNRIYVVISEADNVVSGSYRPLICVFQVIGTATETLPRIGTLSGNPKILPSGANPDTPQYLGTYPGAVRRGDSLILTAGNVYDPSGSGIKGVDFLIDGVKVGVGKQTTVMNSDHNWQLTIATTNLAVGTHTVEAVATSVAGNTSQLASWKLTIR